MKRSASYVLGSVQEKRDSAEPLNWTVEFRHRGKRRFLWAVAYTEGAHGAQEITPFELTTGRDFLVAVRACVYELTGFAVDEAALRLWIERLYRAESSYGKKAKAALASEAMYSINEPPGALPILYRNRRLVVLDARAAPDFSYGSQVVLIDHLFDIEAGTADWRRTGMYEGLVIYGPYELSVSGETLGDLAADCLRTYLWALDN